MPEVELVELFLNAGSPAGETAQVVELGATHVTTGLDLYCLYRRAVGLETPLDPDAVGYLADDKG